MRLAVVAGGCVLLGLTAFSSWARADEEKIAVKDVPKAVLDAVKAKFPKGEIKSAEKEVEDGKTTYEVSLKDDGRSLDVVLRADGAIQEIEKELDAKNLPKAVAASLKTKHPDATVKKAEEIVEFERGKEVKSYEVVLTASGKKAVEVKLSADGRIVKQEEDDDDDDDDDENDDD